MNREEVIEVRQRLIKRKFQPISVYNWDFAGIPLKHRGKRPIESNWQHTVGMPVYYDTAQNTGVLTGVLFPLDIDVDDPAIVDEIVAMAEILLGRTIIRCRPNSPRRLLTYRFKVADPKKLIVNLSCGKCEFLGLGQHFTAFGKHLSGADYEWQGQSLDETDIDKIPIIDPAKLSAFAAWAENRWPVPEKAKPNGAGRNSGANGAKADFRNTTIREDVEAALKTLPCDYDRETWVRLGMAYRASGGSYPVFLAWSRQHPDYRTESYVRGQWKSFENSHSVTAATLFAEVFDRFPGWKKPSERGTGSASPGAGDGEDWDSETDAEARENDDPPLPLYPSPENAEPYPIASLGPLKAAAEAIASSTVVAPALAAQSVLAVASLAAMPIANVKLPSGHVRPLSLNLVTIAKSGERKSTSDLKALIGVKMRSDELNHERELKARGFGALIAAYNAEFQIIKTDRKINLEQRRKKLEALGPAPSLPPRAVFISNDLTAEGLLKGWGDMQPVHGLFTSEGAVLTNGAAMSDDLKMRTAGILSSLWDEGCFTKIRAGDGITDIRGKRLAVHIMIQPSLVGSFLGDQELRGQGFLSRFLIAWPVSRIGSRPFRLINDTDETSIRKFGATIHALLRQPYTLKNDDQLEPRTLEVRTEGKAFEIWRDYHDEVDAQLKEGGRHSTQTDVGSKSAEQAGRIAGVLTIIANPKAPYVTAEAMEGGVTLARWYLNEALRLENGSVLDPALADAERLLKWLHATPERRTMREVQQFGPNRFRELAVAERLLEILARHGWIVWQDKKKRTFTVRDAEVESDEI
jgi:Protein of unknown function (DUF3987)/Primase C terminal 2 (PriCT-2)